ncbi:MAG: hypothetical protein IRY99_06910 [Isosphaeraceae bacterium]|nr:hypothetical protein [Isosphaeraceae bacterium]
MPPINLRLTIGAVVIIAYLLGPCRWILRVALAKLFTPGRPTLRRCGYNLWTWGNRHLAYLAELALFSAIVFGLVGHDYGLRDLFWHENPLTQLCAGAGVAALVFLVLGLGDLRDGRLSLNLSPLRALTVLAPLAGLTLAVAVDSMVVSWWTDAPGWKWNDFCLPIGMALTTAGVVGLTVGLEPGIPGDMAINVWLASMGLLALLAYSVVMAGVTAAVTICLASAMIASAGTLMFWRPIVGFALVVVGLLWVAFSNGRDPYKLMYDHLTEYAEPGKQARIYQIGDDAPSGDPAGSGLCDEPQDASPASPRGDLLDDEALLKAWLKQRLKHGSGPTETRLKLVVVAVSGGGIAAAVWTSMNLKRLEEQYPEFPRHVRLVTGASGGMLGAAYYVASIQAPPTGAADQPHAPGELERMVNGLAEDSLTPVVRQMLFLDLPSIGAWWRQSMDRGWVLERTWERNTQPDRPDASPLAGAFRDLGAGEAAGWRPSLIISPLLIEEGTPMLISNIGLDLGTLSRLQFFTMFPSDRFPSAHRLKVSTAVRMNAAFPYVSPATNLPTDPPRRVVDAGYYDNYGIEIACAWIRRNREWLARNTSGVVLVQIRAYPTSEVTPTQKFRAALTAGMYWLTSPLEGYTAVNRQAMLDRNKQNIREVQEWFQTHSPNAPFQWIILQCPETAPLSWYMKKSELKTLTGWAESDDTFRHAISTGQVDPKSGFFPEELTDYDYYTNLNLLMNTLGKPSSRLDE